MSVCKHILSGGQTESTYHKIKSYKMKQTLSREFLLSILGKCRTLSLIQRTYNRRFFSSKVYQNSYLLCGLSTE